jgi:hypothetical protein
MPLTRNYRNISFPKVSINLGALSVDRWNRLLESDFRFPRTISDVTANNFSAVPTLVILLSLVAGAIVRDIMKLPGRTGHLNGHELVSLVIPVA